MKNQESPSRLVDAFGRPITLPARPSVDPQRCPGCGRGPEVRRASAGFGAPHTVCNGCGYAWKELPWNG